MIRAHWQDQAAVALGLWLVASPFILDMRDAQSAAWAAMLAGVGIVTFAADAFYYPEIIEEWGILELGLLLAASPWLLGYVPLIGATVNAVFCGLAIVILSFLTVGEIRRARRARLRRVADGGH